MSSWEVATKETDGWEWVYTVSRDNPKTGKKETIGTFDNRRHAQEFAEAMNKGEQKNGR